MRIVIRVFPGGVFKTGARLPLVKSYCAFMVDCDVALLVPFVVSIRDGLLIVQDGDCVGKVYASYRAREQHRRPGATRASKSSRLGGTNLG